MVYPASRDFALHSNGSRWFQTVRTGSIPATSTMAALLEPLATRAVASRSVEVHERQAAPLRAPFALTGTRRRS